MAPLRGRGVRILGFALFVACLWISIIHWGSGSSSSVSHTTASDRVGSAVQSGGPYTTLESSRSAVCSLYFDANNLVVSPGSGNVCMKQNVVGPGDNLLRRSRDQCPRNSFSFFGTCPCFPGYSGNNCELVMPLANPWYTAYCPNLDETRKGGATYNETTPVDELGGEFFSFGASSTSSNACAPMINQPACAYLCYSHPHYGTAVVPKSLWRTAQKLENDLWRGLGGFGSPKDDRAREHWRGFRNFNCISDSDLGRVIEVGAGPWTQLKGILQARPNLIVREFTVFEPGANSYMRNVQSCSYRSGKLENWLGNGHHEFPVIIKSHGGELLQGTSAAYDTLISINVLEHVQNAFAYLTGLHGALRPGGLLIFHERFYGDDTIIRGDAYHPVRIKRQVLDTFLSSFDILFNNCAADYDNRKGEEGYYVIARKKTF